MAQNKTNWTVAQFEESMPALRAELSPSHKSIYPRLNFRTSECDNIQRQAFEEVFKV